MPLIPLPTLDKQKEISEEANRSSFEAQLLSWKADKILEDTQAKIGKNDIS